MVLEMAGKTDPGLFRAGVGRAVITPPVGFVIDGPEHGARESTGVLDDLLARVIVLESNGTRVILVSLDVWGLSTGISGSIKTAAGAASGGDANSVWLTTTGNASSPPLWRDDPQYARYAAYLPEQIAGAARMAVGSLEPASMGSKGTLLPDVSTFIEGPGRPGNAALFVMAINRADGSGIARVLNFACPATILGESTMWTADYPGYASWAIEQNGGGLTLFSQAPSHDIRPYDWWDNNPEPTHAERSPQDVHAMGLLLATQAANGAAETTQRRNVEVDIRNDELSGIQVMRIGDAYFVSTDRPQPNKFARRFRRELTHSNTFVSVNLSGGMFDDKATFDARAIKRGTAILRELGAS
ncbi:MAG TPA: hypothetical protein EYQ61_09960 [Dehalococcoidia bacterium]|jgi:hypothetical protein|nr:hypothetical protein [Dehalococcoidia bacterium]HIK88116.1 hypothetical protein [Dehalococcoidia bacterium]